MSDFPANIPSASFYESKFLKLLPIARYILRINSFIPRATDLFSRMIQQDGNRATLTKQL